MYIYILVLSQKSVPKKLGWTNVKMVRKRLYADLVHYFLHRRWVVYKVSVCVCVCVVYRDDTEKTWLPIH